MHKQAALVHDMPLRGKPVLGHALPAVADHQFGAVHCGW